MAKTGEASFEIYKDVAGEFRFRLRAPNGKIVAVGEGYDTKPSCVNGINALKEHSSAAIKDLTIGETTLILDEPPRNVKKHSTIAFSGKLIGTITGEGIPEAKIDIYDSDRPLTKDDHVASGKTRGDGTFDIEWHAKKMDWLDNSIEVYAHFEGTPGLRASRSNQHSITVS
jgi:uncharacterized protein YegP (UPF0339 family)